MKEYNSPKHSANKIDRIQRAVSIIENGNIYRQSEGVYRVLTPRFAGGYTVTLQSCDCHDYAENLQGAAFCKHQWAAIGATAALLIRDIRKAESIKQLEVVGKQYADAMKSLPAAFVRIARAEYKQRHEALKVKSREEEASAVLVKPQLNGGRYGGIDV